MSVLLFKTQRNSDSSLRFHINTHDDFQEKDSLRLCFAHQSLQPLILNLSDFESQSELIRELETFFSRDNDSSNIVILQCLLKESDADHISHAKVRIILLLMVKAESSSHFSKREVFWGSFGERDLFSSG